MKGKEKLPFVPFGRLGGRAPTEEINREKTKMAALARR